MKKVQAFFEYACADHINECMPLRWRRFRDIFQHLTKICEFKQSTNLDFTLCRKDPHPSFAGGVTTCWYVVGLHAHRTGYRLVILNIGKGSNLKDKFDTIIV